MSYKVPENWEEKNLIELCNIKIGKTPNRSTLQFWDKNLLTNNTWLSIADLSNSINKEVFKSKEQISDMGASTIKLVKKGTLLLSFKLTIGRVAIAGKDLYTNEAIAQLPIKDKNKIDKYYLYYYLQNFNYDKLLNGDIKVKGKTLNKEKLKTIPIKYPPLLEQQRIVKILDEVFENIEKAKKNAEQNLNNVKELYESYSQNLLFNITNAKQTTIGNECYLMTGGTPDTKKEENYKNGEIKWLVSGDIHQGKIYDCLGRITKEGLNSSNAKYLPLNSVLIALNGQGKTRGTVALLKTEATCNQSLVSIMPNSEEKLSTDYLYQNLRARYIEIRKMTGDSGNDRRGLNMNLIRSIKITIPNSLEEQKNIAIQLDTLQEQTKKLEQIYTQKIKNLEELKQSILQKAFNGEL